MQIETAFVNTKLVLCRLETAKISHLTILHEIRNLQRLSGCCIKRQASLYKLIFDWKTSS